MNWEADDMSHESDSDSEYEVISLNPNIIYESDDDLPMVEVSCQTVSPVKRENPSVEKKLHQEVKDKLDSVSTQTIESPSIEIEDVKKVSVAKFEESSCDSIAALDENSMNSNDSVSNSPKKVRKKLNLQEYKMRRANEPEKPLFDVPRKIAAYELCDVPSSLPLLLLPTDPAWIASNQKSLAQDTERYAKSTSTSFNPALFEEITIVSMGCNTDITMPPYESDETCDGKPGPQFLTNIVNKLNKDNVVSLLNSSTSLFSSIQAVVQGKCISTEVDSDQSCEVTKESNEHGEDKTIMHLRKDRLRPFKCSVGLQTDSISLFPPLLLTPCLTSNRLRKSRSYRRRISHSRSRSRSFSPSMDFERVRYNNKYSKSQHSTHSSSMNSSDSSSESDSDSSDSSSSHASSDSLNRFNDRQNFRFYNRNQRDQGYNYQEERKIIYIGGLEEDTTKDEIRRKFLEYGTIKKISFHSKDDGLRYGFVTFAEAECAYEVIDKFTKDPTISKYDIRFGGRRKFCKQNYADLDSIPDSEYADSQKSTKNLSFEDLLLLAKKKLSGKK